MAAHRYWRLALNTVSTGAGAYGFAEVQFRTTTGVSLPFSGGTATAAQVFGGIPGAYDATKAADGDVNTLYSSLNTAQPQWWQYDYGAGNALAIVEIAITARNDSNYTQAPTSFTPLWSDDGVSWTSMTTVTTATWTTAGQTQTFAITTGSGTSTLMTYIAIEEWAGGSSPSGGTGGVLAQTTQVAMEEWGRINPQMIATQIALEQWATVGSHIRTFSARHV